MSHTHAPVSTLLALAGATVLAVLQAAHQPAEAASLSLDFPSCTSVTLIESSPGSYTLNCVSGPTTPGAPTGCVATAFTTPSPLTSGGGTVSLAGTCAGAPTTWSWTKDGLPFSSVNAPTDTLPANTGSAAVTYRYAVTACNGAGCAPAVSAPAVSVPSALAPPATTPPAGPIACAGFAGTTVVNLPWVNTAVTGRIQTTKYGRFGPNDALVVKFTVPAGFAGSATFSMAEWGGGPVSRFATLSTTACEFGKANWLVDAWTGPTIYPSLQVGGAPRLFWGQLSAGQTYFLNVRNSDRYGNPTCSDASCDMYIDFTQR